MNQTLQGLVDGSIVAHNNILLFFTGFSLVLALPCSLRLHNQTPLQKAGAPVMAKTLINNLFCQDFKSSVKGNPSPSYYIYSRVIFFSST